MTKQIVDNVIMMKCEGELGSGILISSRSTEYDYILTAKHCLKEYKEPSSIKINSHKISVKEVYNHKNLDISIIKIEKQNRAFLYSYTGNRELDNYEGKVIVCGYPGKKRESEVPHYDLSCTVEKIIKDAIYMEVEEEVNTFTRPAKDMLKGMSGGPAYIYYKNEYVLIGIYNKNAYSDFAYKQIEIIPIDKFNEIIQNNNLEPLNFTHFSKLVKDDIHEDPLYEKYEKLDKKDFRNLSEKIKDVSSEYNERKIKLLSRKIANTIEEIDRLSPKTRKALLYRVFLSSNEKQLDLISDVEGDLTPKDLDNWIEEYIDYSKKIIDQKSEEYQYYLTSRETIKGIVLYLVDNCYISFDECGFYEGED